MLCISIRNKLYVYSGHDNWVYTNLWLHNHRHCRFFVTISSSFIQRMLCWIPRLVRFNAIECGFHFDVHQRTESIKQPTKNDRATIPQGFARHSLHLSTDGCLCISRKSFGFCWIVYTLEWHRDCVLWRFVNGVTPRFTREVHCTLARCCQYSRDLIHNSTTLVHVLHIYSNRARRRRHCKAI